MACTVYCLVPHPEQVAPVVARVRGAGVATRDVAVLRRHAWENTDFSQAATAWAAVLPAVPWWQLSFDCSCWWWRWLGCANADDGVHPMAGEYVANAGDLIRLADYERAAPADNPEK